MITKKKKEKASGRYIYFLFIGFGIAYIISTYLFQFMLIQGESMSPSYHNMQLVILDKYTKEYSYGDVIAFRCSGLSSVLVKRIVACEGDTIKIEDGTLYINGDISRIYQDKGIFQYAGLLEKEKYLKEGQYFVIGDNVAESKDSRYKEVGIIFDENIIGRVVD